MPRKPTDDDTTKNPRPEDERQAAPKGTKIGKLRHAEILADFCEVTRLPSPED